MHSFLLIGQSNAADRGFIHEVEPIENDKLFVLRNGRWQNMFIPVNPDKLHFTAIAQREFGVRYYNEFLKLEDKNKVFYKKATPDAAIRTSIENL